MDEANRLVLQHLETLRVSDEVLVRLREELQRISPTSRRSPRSPSIPSIIVGGTTTEESQLAQRVAASSPSFAVTVPNGEVRTGSPRKVPQRHAADAQALQTKLTTALAQNFENDDLWNRIKERSTKYCGVPECENGHPYPAPDVASDHDAGFQARVWPFGHGRSFMQGQHGPVDSDDEDGFGNYESERLEPPSWARQFSPGLSNKLLDTWRMRSRKGVKYTYTSLNDLVGQSFKRISQAQYIWTEKATKLGVNGTTTKILTPAQLEGLKSNGVLQDALQWQLIKEVRPSTSSPASSLVGDDAGCMPRRCYHCFLKRLAFLPCCSSLSEAIESPRLPKPDRRNYECLQGRALSTYSEDASGFSATASENSTWKPEEQETKQADLVLPSVPKEHTPGQRELSDPIRPTPWQDRHHLDFPQATIVRRRQGVDIPRLKRANSLPDKITLEGVIGPVVAKKNAR